MRNTLALLIVGTIMASSVNAKSAPARNPVAVGTFIQQYLVKDWTDAQWMAEYRAMMEVGMRYLVFGNTADGKDRVTWYPTTLEGWRLAEGYTDPLDACLRNAEKAGIRVFIGLNFHEDWWRKAASDPEWLYAQMREGNAVASEIHRKYYAKYPKAFAGWYWVWEVDNMSYQKPEQRTTLAKALDINVRHLKTLKPALPVMLCPFMNYRLGTPDQYRETWEYVFANTALGKGDIFAPQDCVGAGGLTIDRVDAWFAALRKAVDTKPGLRFWVDTETFTQEDWTSATLDRFVRQMQLVQPHVEACITFAYSHYYSPNKVDPGWQKTYLGYVKSGKLEAQKPTDPGDVRVQRLPDGSVKVQWEPSTDNIGVCGYYVFRDGELASRQQQDPKTVFAEQKVAGDTMPVYEVQAYDFAGNTSARVAARITPG